MSRKMIQMPGPGLFSKPVRTKSQYRFDKTTGARERFTVAWRAERVLEKNSCLFIRGHWLGGFEKVMHLIMEWQRHLAENGRADQLAFLFVFCGFNARNCVSLIRITRLSAGWQFVSLDPKNVLIKALNKKSWLTFQRYNEQATYQQTRLMENVKF